MRCRMLMRLKKGAVLENGTFGDGFVPRPVGLRGDTLPRISIHW